LFLLSTEVERGTGGAKFVGGAPSPVEKENLPLVPLPHRSGEGDRGRSVASELVSDETHSALFGRARCSTCGD